MVGSSVVGLSVADVCKFLLVVDDDDDDDDDDDARRPIICFFKLLDAVKKL